MKTKALYLAWICLLSGALFAQSPRVYENPHRSGWVLQDRLPGLEKLTRRNMMRRTNVATCNNDGICDPVHGESCTTCGDCTNLANPGAAQCTQLAQICNRYNFVGGKPGPAYTQCLDDTYIYLMYFLDYFSQKYAAPGSNIVSDPSPLTPSDGKCNQYIYSGTCGGFPTENCYNDPQDCGPCPTIANITDPNEAAGTCDPAQCAQGACTAGQCGVSNACQFNCGSAHYGGTYPGITYESDAVDFTVDATSCSALAVLSDTICASGSNFISYGLEIPSTLHVSVSTRNGSFPSSPDSTGVTPVACPLPNSGPPSFRAWLAATSINNTLFAVGGGTCNGCAGFGGNEVATVETYDATSGAWYAKRALQTARFGLSASTVNGKVYAFGGTSGNQSLPMPTVEEYDPGTNLWSTRTTMPTPRWKLTSASVAGVIYAIGGGATGNQCVASKTVEAYNPVANKWVTKKPMPTARWGAASDALNGQIYVVGGSQMCPQINVVVSAALDRYDPAANKWTVLKPMLTPRWDLAAAAANGKFYAIGGWDPAQQMALPTVEEFDPGTNSWMTKSPMLTARSGLVAVSIAGKIYVFGGVDQFNQLLATIEIYDPTTDKWAPALPVPPVVPPSITLVSPASAYQGTTIPFIVSGSNFDVAATMSFSGNGITINSQSLEGGTEITASITIAGDAPIGAQDVIVTNSDGQKGVLTGGFSILESIGFLNFPLMNKTKSTATINTVFDHSMTSPYCPETTSPQLVTAYTGEQGSSDFITKSAGPKFTCQITHKQNILYGYQKDFNGTLFTINGHYVGAGLPQFLYYDGHPGFDYRTTDQNTDGSLCQGGGACNSSGMTPVLTAADGTIVCVNISQTKKAPCNEGSGEIKIDHSNGYFTIYLHLSSSTAGLKAGDKVTSAQQIGVSGSTGTPNPHLHFEIRKGVAGSKCPASTCVPVDPYGWLGQGIDPYTPIANNINLWK